LKKGFAGKKDTPPGANKSYAQLFAKTEKLKASRKKLKKALIRKTLRKIRSVSMLTAVIVTAATPTPNEGVGRVATGD
jgi:hypothetical protein